MRDGPGWYVTDGAAVVGPFATSVLVRGVAHGIIDGGCLVWQEPWPEWRDVADVREIRAFFRARATRGASWVPQPGWAPPARTELAVARAAAWIEEATDVGEVVSLTLQALVLETRSSSGLAHRARAAMGPLETRWAFGERVVDRLGEWIDPGDAAMKAARLGAAVLDPCDPSPRTELACHAASRRLGRRGELRGVAWVPIFAQGRLAAVIELGKTGAPFRKNDREWLKLVSRACGERIARLPS